MKESVASLLTSSGSRFLYLRSAFQKAVIPAERFPHDHRVKMLAQQGQLAVPDLHVENVGLVVRLAGHGHRGFGLELDDEQVRVQGRVDNTVGYPNVGRSAERRVGKECVSTCRARGWRYH